MLLVIDNYDSFTFNLVQYLGELAEIYPLASHVCVKRNDSLSLEQIKSLNPKAILLSPGPGDPKQSGICLKILEELSPSIPTLGVCLGHQAIGSVFGGNIIRAKELMHGKTSKIKHTGKNLFKGIPQPLIATRYHSLIIEKESLPKTLQVTAWLEDGTIMGVQHAKYSHIQGVQFHPESVLTQSGHLLLGNFLRLAESYCLVS